MHGTIAEIKRRHPWPDREPDAPEDWHGWLRSDTHAMLYRHLSARTRLVVECGSWLGLSTRAILFGAPNATVICCDHWKGSPEQQADPDCTRRLPVLYTVIHRIRRWLRRLPKSWRLRKSWVAAPPPYETFLRNLWPWRDRVIPIRADSLDALAEIEQAMVGRRSACPTLQPDLVYLDTEHTYDRVSRELDFCNAHWPSAVIVGDDYDWPEVARAANEHAEKSGRPLFGQGTAYRFLPE